jgi:transcriptional regulator GlxA family with amidase domain
VAFVVFEGFQSMALAAMPVFEYANFSAGEALYDVRVLSDGRSFLACFWRFEYRHRGI